MPFRHPRERLAELLRTRGSTPELEAFKQQLRWIARVGGGSGLEHWLDARRELGLLTDPQLERLAEALELQINRWHELVEKDRIKSKSVQPSWDERQRLLNEREIKRRQTVPRVGYVPPTPQPSPKRLSIHERMAMGWEALQRRQSDDQSRERQ